MGAAAAMRRMRDSAVVFGQRLYINSGYPSEQGLKLMNGINPYRRCYLYASGDFPCRVQRLVAVAVAVVVVVVATAAAAVGDLRAPSRVSGLYRFMAGTR
ncbi:Hypothetical protein CINCED_3A021769 [Cinara cedri]|uniref:Uncharacterized protein n=1 Tax=Cinara cedri TaxID=506608 RepID=A0A5E4NL12_9HEMI|nr:Hypothetical protein CINCED_3A021769 [Cinara cedri]